MGSDDTAMRALAEVLREARALLARPDIDCSATEWEHRDEAVRKPDHLIATVERKILPPRLDLADLFAPNGLLEKLSLDTGRDREFTDLAIRFDAALESVSS